MSYNDKIQQARTLLESHNGQLPESDHLKIEDFFTNLRKAGGTTEEALGIVTWEDLESCGIPRILARTIANGFRVVVPEPGSTDSKPAVTKWRVSNMTSRELIQNYDSANEPLVARLKSMSKDQPFLVFDDQGKVVEDTSHQNLLELQRGFPAKKEMLLNGKYYQFHKAGEMLDEKCDENPLFPGEVLRPDGTCDRTGFKWESAIPFAVKQILYLAVKNTKEIVIEKLGDAHVITDFIANAKTNNLLLAAQMRYKEATIQFLTERENPKLKISLKDVKKSTVSRKDDPFYAK